MTLSRHAAFLWVSVIVLAALALRAIGLKYGLPHLYHQDEPLLVNHALAIGATRDWNPHFFTHGPLTIYALFVLYAALFVVMKVGGAVQGSTDFAIQFLKDPTIFYYVGRILIGVAPGVASVYAMARWGNGLWSKSGLYAAAFLSVIPLYVQTGHFISPDAPLALAATAVFMTLCLILEAPSSKRWMKLGAWLGFGLACKLTAAFLIPSVVCTAIFLFFSKKIPGVSRAVLDLIRCGAVCAAVFFILAPFNFLDWPHFWAQMQSQRGAETVLEPWFHLNHSLAWGVGAPVLVLAAIGAAAGIRAKRTSAWLILFWVVSIYLANTIVGMRFARRILPLIPALCVAAGWGMAAVLDRIKGRSIRWLVASLMMTATAVPAVYLDRLLLSLDTRTECLAWFRSQVPAGEVIVLDNRFFGPRLEQTTDLIERKKESLQAAQNDRDAEVTYISGPDVNRVRSQRLELMSAVSDPAAAYRVYTLSEAPRGAEVPLVMLPVAAPEAGELDRLAARYVVFNYSEVNPRFHALKEVFGTRLRLEAAFTPYKDTARRRPIDRYESTAAPLDWRDVLSRRRLGPYLEVYRLMPPADGSPSTPYA